MSHHVERSVGNDRSGVNRLRILNDVELFILFSCLENDELAVLVSEKHFTIYNESRSPDVGKRVVLPVFLTRLCVETEDATGIVSYVNETVSNGRS